jgi:hypothetical protein
MSDSIRAHLRDSFQRRLHPEITPNGQSLLVKIEVARLRLPKHKIVEAQRKHPCCKFDTTHLIMEGEHDHLCQCIDFLAQSEEDPWASAHARDGRRQVPKSAVR